MYTQLYKSSLYRPNLDDTCYMNGHQNVILANFYRTWFIFLEDGVITQKQVWVKKNYMNTYIVGAFDGLIKENRLQMSGMTQL